MTTKVTGKRTAEIINRNLLEVIAGLHQVTKQNASHVQRRGVVQIISHEKFDFDVFDSDLALLKLDHEVRISRHVKPVCLPESPE